MTVTRRLAIGGLAATAVAGRARGRRPMFDVHDYGAAGDGVALDTAAIQRAIDAAALVGGGARVLLRAGRRYLSGSLILRGGIDFHLAGDATLIASARPRDYTGDGPAELNSAGITAAGALLHARAADRLTLSGTGAIDGQSPAFMERYDAENEWWIPKKFRPRILVLENCADLVIRDLSIRQAPSWTIHLLGCRRVLVDRVTIRNQLDVPNCDGIDPDHCQNVEIRNCDIACGDDAIVIKTTKGHDNYGPSRDIHVHNCVLRTQDSGLKIGTETTQDIHALRFERIRILEGCRGLCIQLRDTGSVYDILFRDIEFTARHFSAPWWGRGEAISFTAIPRALGIAVGTIRDVRVENVRGRAENSIRIEGLAGGRVSDIALNRVDVTFARTTRYPGSVFDNRPTSAAPQLETHTTPGISIRNADRVSLVDCAVRWGRNPSAEFGPAISTENVTALTQRNFHGAAAHRGRT